MSDTQTKLLMAGLLMVGWAAIVVTGHAPYEDLVSALKAGLLGLGYYHALTKSTGTTP